MSPYDPIAPIPTANTAEDTGRPIRQRAPRRTGRRRRAQLTVPEDMWRQLTKIARAAGTTPNDALVRLAAERLDDRQRALDLQRRADERWRAFAVDTSPPETTA